MPKNDDTKKSPPNPYLDGRREWNERYGSYIKQAANWRMFAFMSTLIAMGAVAGLVYIGSQSKVTPYIIEVDKLGNIAKIGKVAPSNGIDERVVKHTLADFVINFRTVYPDPQIQKQHIYQAYNYLLKTDPTYRVITEYYKSHSPFERMQKERAGVKIRSILKMSDNTYQIDWTEEVRSKSGQLISKKNYRGLATIQFIPPKNEEEIYKNPLGIYLKEFTWSEVL